MRISRVEICNRQGQEYLYIRYLLGNFTRYKYPDVFSEGEFNKLPDDVKAAIARAGVTASSLSLGQREWFVLEPRQSQAVSSSSSSAASQPVVASALALGSAASSSSSPSSAVLVTPYIDPPDDSSCGLGSAIRDFGQQAAFTNLETGTGNTTTNVMAAAGDSSAQYATAIREVDPNIDQQVENAACCIVKIAKCCWGTFCDND